MPNVLELMLISYAFMVSGLFVPLLGLLFRKRLSNTAALLSMISGGSTTILLKVFNVKLPFDLDANIFGIATAAIIYLLFSFLLETKENDLRRK